MAFFSLPTEAKRLARTIYKFPRNIGNKKASCIEFTLQELVDHIATIKPINPPLFDIFKRKTRAAASTSSCFYNSFWFTNADKFSKAIVCFEEIIANSQTIDSSL